MKYGDIDSDALGIEHYEIRHAMEHESMHKISEVERLLEVSRNDSTASLFISGWKKGHFRSLEEMLCRLAAQLVTEKETYAKMAVKTLANSPLPSSVVDRNE